MSPVSLLMGVEWSPILELQTREFTDTSKHKTQHVPYMY